MQRSQTSLRCSFCGLPSRRGEAVQKEQSSICGDCLTAAGALASNEDDRQPPAPAWIKSRLDRHVIGQERAKRQLAVAVHTHYKRLLLAGGDVEIGKSNVLLIGPTGTGKTHLVRSLARCLSLPLHIGDATALTEAGYVGEDVDSLLAGLIAAADGDVQRAQRGILYLDEIDKLGSRSSGHESGRDVGGEGVQQALLKLIEGAKIEVNVGPRKQQRVSFDTSSLLVICGGAFQGLDALIERRLHRRDMGFATGPPPVTPLRTTHAVRPQDLHAFGLIPELVGRLPVLAALDALDEDALVRILTEPRGALFKQYQRLLRMDGVELRATEAALRALAARCIALGTGARSLRGVLETLLLDVMFEVPSRDDIDEIWLTEDVVQGLASLLPTARPLTG